MINYSPNKELSKKVRAIIGRYLWKISRDLWIWKDASIRYALINELSRYPDQIRVVLIWKSSRDALGFKVKFIGNIKSVRNEFGLFLHDESRKEIRNQRKGSKDQTEVTKTENLEILW